MKELSIEEKAKRYDEAYKKVAVRFGSNVADEIFLKESEDERIRKALLYYHKNAPEQYTCGGLTNAEVVAWLEKQGEKGTNGNNREIPNATMDEETVSEDLEEAMNRAADETRLAKAKNGQPFFSEVDFNLGFSNGAQWQKELMMTKAIDGTARPDDNEIWCNLASFNLKDGDEVKVIVIKEE